MNNYRSLTESEIQNLKIQACSSNDWDKILVKDGFNVSTVRNVAFSGDIKLGIFKEYIEIEEGVHLPSGIYNSYVINSEILDNALVSNVNLLANYLIEEYTIIKNVGSLVVNGYSTFGNGTEIDILNEGGGRELNIFDKISSQIAHLIVKFRHEPVFIDKLENIIKKYCQTKSSEKGTIGYHSKVINCTEIKNTNIGEYAKIEGVQLLKEGTVVSNEEAPTIVGEGVIAKNFIFLDGSKIDSGAIIDKSFVGQGTKIGKQFSAENSAFFANCEGFHGEACSTFAGPYTITHHKSTLLIAGMFSFYNAGSGTNQSNHMYKLGPIHQGELERGSKTGSFSYMLWPSMVGPFSVVMGKHSGNFDASDFPFSYITDEKGRSFLTPGMNLFTVGTRRDIEKWPKRDKRTSLKKLDIIQFEFLNPYLIQKVLNGKKILGKLREKVQKTQESVKYKGLSIYRLMLKTSGKYYDMALKVYLGNQILKSLEKDSVKKVIDEINKSLQNTELEGTGQWIDLSGMIVPLKQIEGIIKQVIEDKITNISDLLDALNFANDNYNEFTWNWFINYLKRYFELTNNEFSKGNLIQIIEDWKTNSLKINNMIMNDAKKEFDSNSKISYGINGIEGIADRDSEAVKGNYESNSFVKTIIKESEEISNKAQSILESIHSIT